MGRHGFNSPEQLLASLPREYWVCPYIVEYKVPGFTHYWDGVEFSFCPAPLEMADWFESFVAQVRSAMGTSFLPVCRLADGEYKMLFWPVLPNPRLSRLRRAKGLLVTAWQGLSLSLKGFQAKTAPGVSSGQFEVREWPSVRTRSAECFRRIGQEGVLALHIGVSRKPFVEEYFRALRRWLGRHGVTLTTRNYVPFYFVYALLRGSAGSFIFDRTRVLVVHSAVGSRQDRIVAAIRGRGAREIGWLGISAARSFNDTLDVTQAMGRYDVCLVGAGVGKALVIDQLRPLQIPVIDAGFVFEVWCDESRARDRTCMVPDEEFR